LDELQKSIVSDLFLRSTGAAFASALALLYDPKQLITNGIYFPIAYPKRILQTPVKSASTDIFDNKKKPCTHKKCCKYFSVEAYYNAFMDGCALIRKCDLFDEWRSRYPPCNDIDKVGFDLVNQHLPNSSSCDPKSMVPLLCPNQLSVSFDSNEGSLRVNDHVDRGIGENHGGIPRIRRVEHGHQHRSNVLAVLSSSLAWGSIEHNIPLVDRRILIATQWMANSFWVLPTGLSLISRWLGIIPSVQIERYMCQTRWLRYGLFNTHMTNFSCMKTYTKDCN
jgi:hypothetical protein